VQHQYKNSEKQIFIAVDKTSECTQEAQNILQNTTVLKLDNNE
jgi:chromosome segregation ATPase